MDYNEHTATEEAAKDSKKYQYRSLIFMLVIIIVMMIFSYVGGNSLVTFSLTTEGFSITPPDEEGEKCTINFADVSEIELISVPDFGTCISGSDGMQQDYGIWQNDLWGNYYLSAVRNIKTCIVVHTDSQIVAFNYESDETTEAIYQYLVELIN